MTHQISHPRVKLLATSSLLPNPRNARTHSDKQLRQIAASIERFGWLVPIVVDAEMMIAAGHGRWEAAKQLGLTTVLVIRTEFLTEDDRRAFAIAENRIAELSGWDDKLLAEELNALFDGGYNLEITGFTTADLDFSVPDQKDQKEKSERVELPDPNASAVTQVGDLWLIGPHRILCGDSTRAESFEAVLGNEGADIVFGDLPYNVPIDGFVSGSGANRHRKFVMGTGEMTPAEFTGFQRAIFRNCVRFS